MAAIHVMFEEEPGSCNSHSQAVVMSQRTVKALPWPISDPRYCLSFVAACDTEKVSVFEHRWSSAGIEGVAANGVWQDFSSNEFLLCLLQDLERIDESTLEAAGSFVMLPLVFKLQWQVLKQRWIGRVGWWFGIPRFPFYWWIYPSHAQAGVPQCRWSWARNWARTALLPCGKWCKAIEVYLVSNLPSPECLVSWHWICLERGYYMITPKTDSAS